MAATTQTAAQQQQAMIANNLAIRQACARSLEMTQKIFSTTLSSNIPGTVVNISPRPVGLVKRFIVEINGTFAQGAAETQTLTKLGPANILSQIVVNDLSNNTRINTSGWHLSFLATARPANGKQIFGAAYTTDAPTAFGNNFNIIKAPASVTTAQSFYMMYEIPLAYSDDDLRGAIYASVVNATMQLQLTVNPLFSVASTADPVLAVYQSSTAQVGVLSSLTLNVYQVYMDQLPVGPQGTLYPPLDCSTIYELKNTALTGLTVGQDFPVQFANQREFQSFIGIFDNGGSLNNGSDLNYIALQAANMVNVFNVDPRVAQLIWGRKYIGDDWPLGTYYFDFRRKPLNTLQTGNMQMVFNPSTVNAGAALLVGWEAMAYINTVVNGASLAAS